jgi:DNA-binding NtrC family response regulator
LVTDDCPEVRELIETGLGNRHACEFTSGLAQAREKLVAGDFQIAICDLRAAEETGFRPVAAATHAV